MLVFVFSLRKSQCAIASKIPVSYLPPPIHRHTRLCQEGSGSRSAWWGNEGCCHLVGIYQAEKQTLYPLPLRKFCLKSASVEAHIWGTWKRKNCLSGQLSGGDSASFQTYVCSMGCFVRWRFSVWKKPLRPSLPCARGQDFWHLLPLVCPGRSAHTELQKLWMVGLNNLKGVFQPEKFCESSSLPLKTLAFFSAAGTGEHLFCCSSW